MKATREEPGTIEYDAATDLEEPNLLGFTEVYEDGEAFAAHADSDHFAAFEEHLPDLLAGEPEVMQYEVSEPSEAEV